MPSWKKIIASGSDAALRTVTASNGFYGNLTGTASWAESSSWSVTASYALVALSSSAHAPSYSVQFNDGGFLGGSSNLIYSTSLLGPAYGTDIQLSNGNISIGDPGHGSTLYVGNALAGGNESGIYGKNKEIIATYDWQYHLYTYSNGNYIYNSSSTPSLNTHSFINGPIRSTDGFIGDLLGTASWALTSSFIAPGTTIQAAGSNRQIQWNNNGALGAAANFNYDVGGNVNLVNGRIYVSSPTPAINNIIYLGTGSANYMGLYSLQDSGLIASYDHVAEIYSYSNGRYTYSSSVHTFSGSVSSSNGFTGSLLGTASWAQSSSQSVTSSYLNGTASWAQNSITASYLNGTASWAQNALTSSYLNGTASWAQNSITASYLNGTASWATNAITASYGNITGSLYGTASWAQSSSRALTASYALTSSAAGNTNEVQYNKNGLLYATSSFQFDDSANRLSISDVNDAIYLGVSVTVPTAHGISTANGPSDIAAFDYLNNTFLYSNNQYRYRFTSHSFTGSVFLKSLITGSTSNVLTYDPTNGRVFYTASSAIGGGNSFPYSGSAIITGSLLVSGSGIVITGSLNVSGGITGSLFGTSSWAVSSSRAITASYALNVKPAGSNTQIQFNNNGVLGAVSDFTWNGTGVDVAAQAGYFHVPGAYVQGTSLISTEAGVYNDNQEGIAVYNDGSKTFRYAFDNVVYSAVSNSLTIPLRVTSSIYPVPIIKAGSVTGSLFGLTSPPNNRTASVNFSIPMQSDKYSVTFAGYPDNRNYTVVSGSKTANGFKISANAATVIAGEVLWTATAHTIV